RWAITPFPGNASNESKAGGVRRRSKAASTTARASGCSEEASAAAARKRSSSSPPRRIASISRTTGRPSVSVPVLLDETEALEGFAGTHQDAPFGGLAGTTHDRKRGGNADRAGIAHDQNAQARKDSALDVRMSTGNPRTD